MSKQTVMIRNNDISTPEGYFENLQQRLSGIPAAREASAPRGVRRLAPYLAYAASLLVAVFLGNAILRKTAAPAEDNGWEYISYLSSVLDPDGAVPDWDDDEEDYVLSDDDIVNYLIADGISVEHLNYVSYEEGY